MQVRHPPPLRWPGDHDAAIAFGRRLVRYGAHVRVHVPGAFVWGGWDHDFHPSHGFYPTRSAWALGDEPMTPIEESDRFDAMPFLDERVSFDAIHGET